MKTKKTKRENEKILPFDFYLEGDTVIFTEQFHIKRGSCCGNGCRHCPYEPKYKKRNITLSKKNP